MKKSTLLLSAVLILSGCAETPLINLSGNTPEAAVLSGGSSESSEEMTVYAEVYDVISNQLSLKVLTGSFDAEEMSERMKQRTSGERQAIDPENMPEGTRFSFDPNNLPEGFTMPENWGEFSDGSGRVRREGSDGAALFSSDGSERTPPAGSFSRYTGEEKDVVIPVGTPIKKISFSSEDGSLQEKAADLADIKNGSTVNIFYNANGGIKEVQIIDQGTMRRGNGSGGNFPTGDFADGEYFSFDDGNNHFEVITYGDGVSISGDAPIPPGN